MDAETGGRTEGGTDDKGNNSQLSFIRRFSDFLPLFATKSEGGERKNEVLLLQRRRRLCEEEGDD